jgi:hypothetical protein
MIISILGYCSAILAIIGSFLVTSKNYKHRKIAFAMWLFTNAFEFLYLGFYLGNIWACVQFGAFWAIALFGFINNYRG